MTQGEGPEITMLNGRWRNEAARLYSGWRLGGKMSYVPATVWPVGSDRTYLVLDIETIPDERVWTPPPSVNRDVRPPFPPVYAHRVVVIGRLWMSRDYELVELSVSGARVGELQLLEELSSFIEKQAPVFVTYNGSRFDLPVLAMRSLHHGVPMPWYFGDEESRQEPTDAHVDLCHSFASRSLGAQARSCSLDTIARLIGLPGKVSVDGSQVEELYHQSELAKIENYCLADVVQTALLFLRFRLLQGRLSPADYRVRAQSLTDALRKDPRLAELMGSLDDSRLLSAA